MSAAVCLDWANKLFFLSTELEDEAEELAEVADGVLTTFCEAVSHAESNVTTLEEFAGLTTDDLIGYFEDKHDKNSKVRGILEDYNLTRDEGDELIMEARKIWLN